MIQAIPKAISVACLLLYYSCGTLFIRCAYKKNTQRVRLAEWTSLLSVAILEELGVLCSSESEGEIPQQGYFIVANHVSYLDVLLIAAMTPTLFVTSREVRSTPFLGLLARLSGSLFVERRSATRLVSEVNEIQEALKQGLNVVVFPEATSTDGRKVLPFKSALFESAIRTKTAVLPVTVDSRSVDGRQIARREADRVLYYGTMEFLPQLVRLLCVSELWVELSIFQPLRTHGEVRSALANRCWNLIRSRHQPIEETVQETAVNMISALR